MDLRLNNNIYLRVVEGEAIGVNPGTGRPFHLNQAATAIFLAACHLGSVQATAEFLADDYSLPLDGAYPIIRDFVAQLLADGLLIGSELTEQTGSGLALSEWKESLEEVGAAALIPVHATIELQGGCHLDCIHCYLPPANRSAAHVRSSQMPSARAAGLDISRTESCLNELVELGCILLTVTGGEPFLHRGVWRILEHASDLGLVIEVLTTGATLDGASAARLAGLRVGRVQISVYSGRHEVHDAITQRRGSFERSLSAARLLIGEGIPVELACTVMRQNFDSFREVASLADSIGARSSIGYPVTARHDRSIRPMDVSLNERQLLELLEYDHRNLQGQVFDDRPLCTAGRGRLAIDGEGNVLPCLSFPLRCGNVHDMSLRDIWKGSEVLSEVRNLRRSEVRMPFPGSQRAIPVFCPGLNYVEEGEPLHLADISWRIGGVYTKLKGDSARHGSHSTRTRC